MAGEIKKMLDKLVSAKSGGNPTLVAVTKTKLILKGLNPDKFSATAADDPVVIRKVKAVAQEMGVSL